MEQAVHSVTLSAAEYAAYVHKRTLLRISRLVGANDIYRLPLLVQHLVSTLKDSHY